MNKPVSFAGSGLAVVRGGRVLARQLDFALTAGGAMVLTGPNGSGKSSLLRIMAGLAVPRAGQLIWGGQPVTDRGDLAGRIGWLGHQDGIKPALSVAEHLAFHQRLGQPGLPVAEAAARVGLADLLARPGRMLSAGQRRRLALARLLVQATPLWLLDEPTNALDTAGTALFRDMVAGHLAAGGMMVAATHLDLGLPQQTELCVAEFAP